MEKKESLNIRQKLTLTTENELPQYETPIIVTYRDEEILEELGPAQTSYGGPG